jgi:hypothetical protein
MPSQPRSWANFSLLSLCHRNARAVPHLWADLIPFLMWQRASIMFEKQDLVALVAASSYPPLSGRQVR